MSKTPAYKRPEYNKHKTLFDFGETEDHDLSVHNEDILEPEAKAERFLALWTRRVRPFKKYPHFRKLVDRDGSPKQTYAQIQNMHKKYVGNGDWTDEKFEYVIDKILEAGHTFSDFGFERHGYAYDNNGKMPTKHSGQTTGVYKDTQEEQVKINTVLDAWAALDAEGEEF